jgi:hypothetical protein
MRPAHFISATIAAFYLALVWCTGTASAQNMIGFNSNYDGAVITYLNPASIVNSKVKLDLNLLTFGAHLQNSYYAIPKKDYKPLEILQSGFDPATIQANTKDAKMPFLYTKVQLHLPTVMYSDGKRAYAFHLSGRIEASAKNLPADLMYFYNTSLPASGAPANTEGEVHKTGKFHAAAAMWEELGFTYAQSFINDGSRLLTAGITANLLFGNFAFYAKGKNVEDTYDDAGNISFQNADAAFGGSAASKGVGGFGLGVNLGANYYMGDAVRNRAEKSGYFHYKYAMGAALLDVGGMRFSGGGSSAVNTIDADLSSGADPITKSDHVSMYLPTALSLQFDYNLNDQFYVGATFFHNLRFAGAQIRRPTVLSVTPRYERKWFEASLPLSLYEWRQARIGLEMRLVYFVIGTEKLGALMGLGNFTGMDLYFSFRFFIGKKIDYSGKPLYL